MTTILLLTDNLNTVLHEAMKKRHVDARAEYLLVRTDQVAAKVKGLTVIGIVFEGTRFDKLTEDARKALQVATAAYREQRGLRKIEELFTLADPE